jgi:DNA-binding MarR family transcriptional regulator
MDGLTGTLLGLFTEVAIVEHLVRTREEGRVEREMPAGHFGILNYFALNHPGPDSLAGLAWAFQEDEDYTRGKVEALAARGLVSFDFDADDSLSAMVALTEEGRKAHAEVVANMAPEIRMAVAEIPAEHLEITFNTLRQIRLTLDNLPDR